MRYEDARHMSKGTLVECHTENTYEITKPGVLCSFVEIMNPAYMAVKVEKGENKGHIFPVLIGLFDVVPTVKEPTENEIFSLLS